ncbi:MAG: bifunctional serine/threonine-protein kinase/formylglycine-generating enzyme family protein, partial [Planctomycetota bacterium]
MSRESDLLLVALALRDELVTPEQISECGAAWAENPSKSLTDLLVENGYLVEADKAALEVLVEAKSRNHEGDACQTLMALNVDAATRQSLLALPLAEDDMGTLLALKASQEIEGGTLLDTDGAGSSVVANIRETFDVQADVDLGHSDEQEILSEAPAARLETDSGKEPKSAFGKHHLIGEIARGGMGAILEARDPDLRRDVAVKVMLPSASANPDVVARFVEEAQVQGQLEHPNVCPVHDIAQGKDGLPYFLMKRVRGKPLSAVIDEYHEGGDMNLTRLIEIFLKICDAMGFAHSRGVIHRDLKPANVMSGDFGEVLVMDWGLAKIAGREETREKGLTVQTDRADGKTDAMLTMDGDVVGTPAYMPPEQADGKVSKMNETSDIYSLGAILYEILAGVPPFSGNPYNIIYKVIEGKVPPPSEHSPDERPSKRLPTRRRNRGKPKPEQDTKATLRTVPRELEAVVLKAMAKKQSDRYASVKEFRDDILAWTEGRTLQAAEYTSLERAAKWVMRNKALSAVLGVVSLAVLVVGGVFWWSAAAQRIAKETGERVAKEEQAKTARTIVDRDMDEAAKYLAACESEYRKAAAPKIVEMEFAPPFQSVAYCHAVENGPMTSPGPYNENAPEPEWHKGPKPPLPVMVLKRDLGIVKLKEALSSGSLATIFADRARERVKSEGFDGLARECEVLAVKCRLVYARALAAAENFEKAIAELKRVPSRTSGHGGALAYAKGFCVLDVASEPAGAEVELFFMPPESEKTAGKAVRKGTTPVSWNEIPRGTYMLRLKKKGCAPVGYHLRLDRDLPLEAAHELAVMAGRDKTFARMLKAERNRLSGSASAHRRVHVVMLSRSKVPGNLIVIPAGSFLMDEDLKPVFLETYFAAYTEVTALEWNAFLREAGRRKRARVGLASDEKVADMTWNLFCRAPNAEDLPCGTLSWDDSRALLRLGNAQCGKTSAYLFALPTEAMWEKAARGVDGRVYPWGNVYDGKKVNGADLRPVSNESTTFTTNLDEVDIDRGSSMYGLRQVSGNLWEWCVNLASTNAVWRVSKGGAYGSNSTNLRLPSRGTAHPVDRISNNGFRVFAVPVSGS